MPRHANHCHEYWRLSPSLRCWGWVLSTPSLRRWGHVASHWDGWADALKGWIKDGKRQSTEAGAALSQVGGNCPQQGNVEGNVHHLQRALHAYQCFKRVKLSRRPWLTTLHGCLIKALALALSSLWYSPKRTEESWERSTFAKFAIWRRCPTWT